MPRYINRKRADVQSAWQQYSLLRYGIAAASISISALPLTASAGPESCWLDSRSTNGTTCMVLKSGVSYIVKVQGTASFWSSRSWNGTICGTKEDISQYPSVGVQDGPVGTDVAYKFAIPK